ncbi:MAG: hypothetical protein F6K54_32580 [Okeania sp. SIO3B5]|uniref:hypothetical protein n=1 Tax=Okeania sp. SIO3B5 TaxID=2607811 RepID=UPI001401B34C|nr:hypothetical protein [Okeania sp. SIO3B5]NEO57398.1 hypothetical protein [Okeania sp. SIO3B5]
MKKSLERKLSNLKEIDFDLDEEVSDDQLEKIYGGKVATFTVGKKNSNTRYRSRFRGLWNFFFRRR